SDAVARNQRGRNRVGGLGRSHVRSLPGNVKRSDGSAVRPANHTAGCSLGSFIMFIPTELGFAPGGGIGSTSPPARPAGRGAATAKSGDRPAAARLQVESRD